MDVFKNMGFRIPSHVSKPHFPDEKMPKKMIDPQFFERRHWGWATLENPSKPNNKIS
jgi:hypothetical protein